MSFEVMLIGDGIGDRTGDPTGVCSVCPGIGSVDYITTSSGSAVEGPGMDISSVLLKSSCVNCSVDGNTWSCAVPVP
jgi:hypothetical protein